MRLYLEPSTCSCFFHETCSFTIFYSHNSFASKPNPIEVPFSWFPYFRVPFTTGSSCLKMFFLLKSINCRIFTVKTAWSHLPMIFLISDHRRWRGSNIPLHRHSHFRATGDLQCARDNKAASFTTFYAFTYFLHFCVAYGKLRGCVPGLRDWSRALGPWVCLRRSSTHWPGEDDVGFNGTAVDSTSADHQTLSQTTTWACNPRRNVPNNPGFSTWQQ